MNLEPVTKTLDELEVGDWVGNNGTRKLQIVDIRKSFVVKHPSGDCETMWMDDLRGWGYTPYTPKKIKVVKLRGKSYPVKEIVKKVKAL